MARQRSMPGGIYAQNDSTKSFLSICYLSGTIPVILHQLPNIFFIITILGTYHSHFMNNKIKVQHLQIVSQ